MFNAIEALKRNVIDAKFLRLTASSVLLYFIIMRKGLKIKQHMLSRRIFCLKTIDLTINSLPPVYSSAE